MVELLGLVSRTVEQHRTAMTKLLTELIAVPTENPPGRFYERCVEVLDRALKSLGFCVEHVALGTPADPRTAIVATTRAGSPTLYFHGHYDVVPADDPAQFAARVEGDTVFGRGSSDMKGGLVSMIYAAKTVAELGVANGGRVALVFVPDEETGGRLGSAALAGIGRLGVDAIGMLLAEPTSGVVWNANRGAISLEVTVKGRAAHVGLAHTGVNAFERALTLINELLEMKRQLGSRSTLLVGGRVDAGSNFNVVPAECRFTIDRRLNPDENLYEERTRLLALFDRVRRMGIDFDVDIIQEGRSAWTAPDDPLAVALRDSVEAVTGTAPAFETCPGLLETRFYADCGIPALAYGPGVLAVSHGPLEFVKMSRVIECAAVYAFTAAQLFAARTAGRDLASR